MSTSTPSLPTTPVTRLETTLEPPAAHGGGEVLDVFVWRTVRRARAPGDVEVRAVADDLAAVAREALPRVEPGMHVDHLPTEPALFESRPGGPDEIRIRFRVLARDRSVLNAWRVLLHENLRAIGVAGGLSTAA